MSKQLRDGVMCFELQIHSPWKAQSQRSHSGGPTPRTKYEDSGQESLVTTNKHTEALHSSTTQVLRNAAQHSAGR